jgi:hypothetical protein
LEVDQPDRGSKYADEGTAAHELASLSLTEGKPAFAYLMQIINGFPVTDDMAQAVQSYVDYVLSWGGTLFVENRMSIAHLTGEEGACGTADAIIMTADRELVVIDYKHGKGVEVDAEDNPQLAMYALAALEEFAFLGGPSTVRVAIHQPRLDHISEAVCTVPELLAIGERIKVGAARCAEVAKRPGAFLEGDLNPGAKQCKWCRAKAICPALANHVMNTVADDFVDLDAPVAPQLEYVASRTVDNPTLGRLRAAVPLIEDWCAAVCKKVEAELLAGNAVPGWKPVRGKRGARKWIDMGAVEKRLAEGFVEEDIAYTKSLISPTAAEKAAKKGDIPATVWQDISALIEQPEGRIVAAPETDKRKPVDVAEITVDDFEDETTTEE